MNACSYGKTDREVTEGMEKRGLRAEERTGMDGDWESEAAALSAPGFPWEPGPRPGKGSKNPSFPGTPRFPTPHPEKQGCCGGWGGGGRGCKDSVEQGGGGGDGCSEG